MAVRFFLCRRKAINERTRLNTGAHQRNHDGGPYPNRPGRVISFRAGAV